VAARHDAPRSMLGVGSTRMSAIRTVSVSDTVAGAAGSARRARPARARRPDGAASPCAPFRGQRAHGTVVRRPLPTRAQPGTSRDRRDLASPAAIRGARGARRRVTACGSKPLRTPVTD